jgi:PilZ domain-containing protein
MSGIENRRSPRIVRRVPIQILADGQAVEAVSAVINKQGALIVAPALFGSGRILHLENRRTERRVEARVVWGSSEAEGGCKLGIEFLEDVDFWGADYSPEPEDADTTLG